LGPTHIGVNKIKVNLLLTSECFTNYLFLSGGGIQWSVLKVKKIITFSAESENAVPSAYKAAVGNHDPSTNDLYAKKIVHHKKRIPRTLNEDCGLSEIE